MKIDLHLHSYYSDGVFNLEQLLNAILEAKIDMFALTDHDTIEGNDTMSQLAKKAGLSFIKGVEVACTFEGKEYHLTTYAYQDEDLLLSVLSKNLAIRKAFDDRVILATGLDTEKFKSYEDDPYIGGWPSFNYLKLMGKINTLEDYFKILEKHNLKMTFDGPETIIPILKACGGQVFLAHPSAYFKGNLETRFLDLFRTLGIDGIECYSPYTSHQEEVNYYLNYCKEYDLKISGGSDYHGGFVNRKLGYPEIKDTMISAKFFINLIER